MCTRNRVFTMKIQYRLQDNYIEIVRCFGTDSKVVIPESIEGLPVRSVAAYAFSPRKVKEDTDVMEYETENSFLPGEDLLLLAGNEIEEIIFPDTVEEIGGYIFYGCKNLLKLEFSDSLIRIGSGAFTGCGKLSHLTVHLNEGKKSCVKEILGELWQRIDVTFYDRTSCVGELSDTWGINGKREDSEVIRLVFPEHYEEAVENTPARILFTQHHGTGNNYRQCFYERELDYRKYDSLFVLAMAQDRVDVLTDLVFCRLESGYELTEQNRQKYEDYIRRNLQQVVKYLLEQERMKWLELISERKLWNEQVLDEAIEWTSAAGKSELTGYLMNERRRWTAKRPQEKKKRFAL